MRVFVIRAVEACERLNTIDKSGNRKSSLFAFVRYAASDLARVLRKAIRTLSHMSGVGFVRAISTGSEMDRLKFLCNKELKD